MNDEELNQLMPGLPWILSRDGVEIGAGSFEAVRAARRLLEMRPLSCSFGPLIRADEPGADQLNGVADGSGTAG
jgi:hypothetical protein